MTAIFDLSRFFKLMRREIQVNIRNYIMVAAFIFGLFFLIYFIALMIGAPIPPQFDSAFFYIFLFAGGTVYTSMTFADVKRPVGYFYLTIPASIFEKAVSKWIITVIGWAIAYTIAYFAFATIGKFSFSLLNDHELVLPRLILKDFPGLLRAFLFSHAIFFLGAATFKKNAFVLTIVALALVGMAGSFISAVLLKIFGIPLEHIGDIIEALTKYSIPAIWVLIAALYAWAFNRLRKTQL